MQSAFFSRGVNAKAGNTASLHLSRDLSIPVKLSTTALRAEDEGYAEGVVTNTKFGSFPHSTLIGVPWGSQVLASKVDTGSRGRLSEQANGKKRKADAISSDARDGRLVKQAAAATSGFIHVLPPTPENWTTSLPHRTQVVYTPDYSYVLQRIRARPGSVLIEAGSGSGSFTHASARAVFSGQPQGAGAGHVFSFEFHAERHQKVKAEMVEHGLDEIVTATHRDVYKDGFLLPNSEGVLNVSPKANAIFLDLPAPWEALPHLVRESSPEKPSAIDAESTVQLCTFSPCIEQVQKTVSVMRRLGWIEIEMVELQHKRIDVRREYTGLQYDGMRSVNAMAVDVDEAVSKLREVEDKSRQYHDTAHRNGSSKKKVVEQNKQQDASKTLYNEGRIVHRTEPDLKTHTSYLVFAVLPRAWLEEDEDGLREEIANGTRPFTAVPKNQRQLKKEAKQRRKAPNGSAV